MPVFSLTDSLFWLRFVYYGFIVFIVYYIPGSLFIRKIHLSRMLHVCLSIVLGMSMIAYQGLIFGYLHVRFMTYIVLAVCFVISIMGVKKKKHHKKEESFSINPMGWFVITIGTLLQMTTIWFTGMSLNGKAYYCCGNANDNFFYGAISQRVTHEIPPEHPGMSGELLQNYHYWSNIVVGETSRISGLPVFQLQFQYSTVLIALLACILLYAFILEIGGSPGLGLWVLFFYYFGSDAIYWLIVLLRSAPPFSMSSLEDGVGFLANYPRAMAIMIGFAALFLFFRTRKKTTLIAIISTVLLFACIAGMKIYVAMFMYFGILCLSVYDFFVNKSNTSAIIGFLVLIIFIPFYLLSNFGAGGLYFLGFWRAQNFIVQPWLNLLRLEQARVIYEQDHKWIQVVYYNVLFTAIYILAIYGTKIIGIFNTKSTLKQLSIESHIFFIPTIIISFLLGFFFNQNTGESNTFNFLVSAFVFSSIYAGLVMNNIMDNKRNKYKWILILLVIILTVPRPLYRAYKNVLNIFLKKSFTLSKNVLSSARFIRENTDSKAVFLVNPKYFKFDVEGPVFSLLVDRPMYYSGEAFLFWFKASPDEIEQRKRIVSVVFTSPNIIEVAAALKKSEIDYVIDVPTSPIGGILPASFLRNIYENFDIRILKIEKNLIPESVFVDVIESTGTSSIRINQIFSSYLL